MEEKTTTMGFFDKVESGSGARIEGKVVDYSWENGFPLQKGGEWVEDESDRQNPDNLHLAVKIQPEGADEDETIVKVMYAGSNRFLVVEDDGKVLRAGEEGEVNEEQVPRLFKEADAAKFLRSLDAEGFSFDARLPDPEETKSIDLRPIIGTRVIIVNEVDAEATKQFGKTKGKGKNKDKEYNRTYLKVSKVLSLPDEKSAAKSTSKTASKSKSKEEDSSTISNKIADEFITEVLNLEGKEGVIAREKLTLAVTRTLNKKKMDLNDNADLRKHVTSEDYLTDAADRGVIEFDPTAKKQSITLVSVSTDGS